MVYTTPDLAAEEIVRRIRDGRILPGQRLPEVELSEDLGLSRNSLREAFHVLAFAGIVDRIPNRGVFVIEPTIERAVDYYGFRRVIEVGALDYVEPSSDTVAQLTEIAAVDPPTSDTVLGFHQTLVDAVGSASLSRSFAHILVLSRLVVLSFPSIQADFLVIGEKNREIVAALAAGDRSTARTRLELYLDKALERVTESIQAAA